MVVVESCYGKFWWEWFYRFLVVSISLLLGFLSSLLFDRGGTWCKKVWMSAAVLGSGFFECRLWIHNPVLWRYSIHRSLRVVLRYLRSVAARSYESRLYRFQQFWNPVDNGDFWIHSMTVVFVMSSSQRSHQIDQKSLNEGNPRRERPSRHIEGIKIL